MPLDPDIEKARPSVRRHMTRKMAAWVMILRFGSTALLLFGLINIWQSDANLWAKVIAAPPFLVFIHSFARDNVSNPR